MDIIFPKSEAPLNWFFRVKWLKGMMKSVWEGLRNKISKRSFGLIVILPALLCLDSGSQNKTSGPKTGHGRVVYADMPEENR